MDFQQTIDNTVTQYLQSKDTKALQNDIQYWCDDHREYMLVIVKCVAESIFRQSMGNLDVIREANFELSPDEMEQLWVYVCQLEAAHQANLHRQKRVAVTGVNGFNTFDFSDHEEGEDIVVTDNEDSEN